MLESLISGKESSPFVVIKDTLAAPGDNLLLVWSHHLRQRFAAVVALHCGTTNLGYETFAVHCLDDLQCKLILKLGIADNCSSHSFSISSLYICSIHHKLFGPGKE